jgi:hypothetical protein
MYLMYFVWACVVANDLIACRTPPQRLAPDKSRDGSVAKMLVS